MASSHSVEGRPTSSRPTMSAPRALAIGLLATLTALACATSGSDRVSFRPVHTYDKTPAKSPDGRFWIEFEGVAHQLEKGALGIDEDAELAFVLEAPELAMAVYRFERPDLDLDDAVHVRRSLLAEGDVSFISEARRFLPGSRYRVASVSRFVDRTETPPVWYCSVMTRGPSDVYEVVTWSSLVDSAEPGCQAALGLRLAPE